MNSALNTMFNCYCSEVATWPCWIFTPLKRFPQGRFLDDPCCVSLMCIRSKHSRCPRGNTRAHRTPIQRWTSGTFCIDIRGTSQHTWMQKHCYSRRPTWSYWMIWGHHNCILFWSWRTLHGSEIHFVPFLPGSQASNLDCMLCISIFYNRQKFDTDRPEYITLELQLAPDYLHNVLERPRQLSGYDVCLKPTHNNWRIPLVVRTAAYATRNKRTRGQFSQDLRYQRWREYQNRSYQQQQSRYYGSHNHGPYARSSSSSGQHWEDQHWALGMLVWWMARTDTTVAKTSLQEQFTDTTVDTNIHFYTIFIELIKRILYLDWFFPGFVAFPTIRYDLWSLTLHGALWMLELKVRPK